MMKLLDCRLQDVASTLGTTVIQALHHGSHCRKPGPTQRWLPNYNPVILEK